MGDLAQLGIGGCFCIGVLKLVFDFLDHRERKRLQDDREDLNGDSPEHRTADALERIEERLQEQCKLLHEQCKLTAANGTKLEILHARFEMLRN